MLSHRLSQKFRFNPCFNGTYSLTTWDEYFMEIAEIGFNPCFNGTYSLTNTAIMKGIYLLGSFNPCFNGTYSLTYASTNIILQKPLF